ncbi:MAG: MATE family efflux transporter [Ignavibacteria bacterium]|nr:MATE family efflux transporter [Ignavibacteria bacterium]
MQEKRSKALRIFDVIVQSLKGAEYDYTQGSINKAVFLLAIPMMLELSLESVFAVVDMFFVSKLGPNAIATVGLTESVITIVYSISIGLSTGATAIIARRVGEKDLQSAARACAQALNISILVSLLISIPGILFAGDILALMGASPDVIAEGTIFAQILLGGNIVIILLFLINGIFRGAGNAAMAMKSLWIASLTNIILCPVLIHFYGLKGAAIATLTGRAVGVIYQCYHLFRGKSFLKISAEYFRINFTLIGSIIKISWPATLQFIIASGSWIILSRLVAETGGTNASAGYQIAFRNMIFFFLPAWGLSNAAATLVGQNLGAKELERAEQSVMLSMKYNIVFMGLVMITFLIFPEQIIRIFTNDEAVLGYGVHALQIIGAGYIFFGIGMVLTQALNGAGDTKTPTMINFICFWVFQVPLAYFLAYTLGLSSTGVFVAIPVAEVLIAAMSWYYFKKGKWKKIKV